MSYPRLRPSPALVVAIVALVAALSGAALAAPVSNKGVSKSKAKKIANKEIDKRAPGLSVAHAETAGNADTVGNRSANDLQTSSGFGSNPQQIADLGATFQSVVTANITTHNTGRVLATASAELTGGAGTRAQCQIVLNGVAGLQYETTFAAAASESTVAINYAQPDLPAGTYTGTLQCKDLTGAVGKDDATMNLYGLGS